MRLTFGVCGSNFERRARPRLQMAAARVINLIDANLAAARAHIYTPVCVYECVCVCVRDAEVSRAASLPQRTLYARAFGSLRLTFICMSCARARAFLALGLQLPCLLLSSLISAAVCGCCALGASTCASELSLLKCVYAGCGCRGISWEGSGNHGVRSGIEGILGVR